MIYIVVYSSYFKSWNKAVFNNEQNMLKFIEDDRVNRNENTNIQISYEVECWDGGDFIGHYNFHT